MDQSSFAQLPKELRLVIYEYAMSTDLAMSTRLGISQPQDRQYSTQRLEFKPDPDLEAHSDRDSKETRASALALTSTCRQLRREALPVFYAVNGIHIESNEYISTTFPTLQMILLTHWLRQRPSGFFRHITISVECQWEPLGKTTPSPILAQRIYSRYVEIASCFDASRTRLRLDLGDMWEPSPSPGLTGCVAWTPASNLFTMTPWTGLRRQVEAHVSETEGKSQLAKARVLGSDLSPEHKRSLVGVFEWYARSSREVLRRLVELVEESHLGVER